MLVFIITPSHSLSAALIDYHLPSTTKFAKVIQLVSRGGGAQVQTFVSSLMWSFRESLWSMILLRESRTLLMLVFIITPSHSLSVALIGYHLPSTTKFAKVIQLVLPRRRCTSTDVCEQSDVVVQGVVMVDDTTEGVKDSLNACIHHNSLSFTISCSH